MSTLEDCKRKLYYCATHTRTLHVKDDPDLWVVKTENLLTFNRKWEKVQSFSITPWKSWDEVITEATEWLLDHIDQLSSMKEVDNFSDVRCGMKVGKSKLKLIGTIKSIGNLRDFENDFDRTFYVGEEPCEDVQMDDIITRYKDDQYIRGFIVDIDNFPKNRIKVDKLVPWDDLKGLGWKVYSL